jgi:hypothetical protein
MIINNIHIPYVIGIGGIGLAIWNDEVFEYIVPCYSLITLLFICGIKISTYHKSDDEIINYNISKPKVVEVVKPINWKESLNGYWVVSEAEKLNEWFEFGKYNAIKRMIGSIIFMKMKHEVVLSNDSFKFARFMDHPDTPKISCTMKLYDIEEEALDHMNDCKVIDPENNDLKCFATYIDEKEEEIYTFISYAESPNFVHITHIRKLIDNDTLSVVSLLF